MKRLLQGLALLQIFLVAALGVRIVRVWTTPLPQFSEIPALPATTPLRPAKPVPKISEAVTEEIVDHDLFDDQRGQGEDILIDPLAAAPPVPPPTSVKLMGVMHLGGEPVGILLDASIRPEQQSVREGEMFGEYEVGEITVSGLTLLGSQGQQFQIPLRVEAAGAGGAPPPPPPARAPAAGAAATRPAPATRPVTARPASAAKGQAAADPKAMTARERAQSIAQRNAELRKGQQQNAPAGEDGENKGGAPDPVQARLESLRQLREAAKGGN